jgi:hypothetical protein
MFPNLLGKRTETISDRLRGDTLRARQQPPQIVDVREGSGELVRRSTETIQDFLAVRDMG